MTSRLRTSLALVALAALLAPIAAAGPLDARVGEVRITWKPDGTSLRDQGSSLAKTTGLLPYGTQVTVLAVNQPWIQVRAPQGTGWMRAAEAIEPSALAPNPRPVTASASGAAGVDQRDISAAGRQFDAATEQRYRATHQDLQQAYALVDRLEQETQALHPAEAVGFIVGAALGRQGQDYARPPLLPPTQRLGPASSSSRPAPRAAPRSGGGIGGLLGGLVEGVTGDKRAGEVVAKGVDTLAESRKQFNEKFTPEHEYYLGRAVAAHTIAKYGVDPNPQRRKYVKLIGEAIVRLSVRLPSTYRGYFFEVLDSDEINGVSGPGGFVLITRGAVEAARTEDEIASVIAHELGHVIRKDGETTLRQGRGWQTMLGGFLDTTATATGVDDQKWAQGMLNLFTQAVGEMSRTAIENDYGRGAEFGADLEGAYILIDVVYDHTALSSYLQTLSSRRGAYGKMETHAPPAVRKGYIDQQLARYGPFRGTERVKEIRLERRQRLGQE